MLEQECFNCSKNFVSFAGNTPAGKHLYFFTPRKMKYPNGTRPARGTNGGYWKASGKDIIIRDNKKREIGYKKSLAFHEGHQRNGKRTNWLMQEYIIKEFWFPTDQNKNMVNFLKAFMQFIL